MGHLEYWFLFLFPVWKLIFSNLVSNLIFYITENELQ
jgi:hypothetical protein